MSFSYNFHDTYIYSGIINPNEKPMKNLWVFYELLHSIFHRVDPMKSRRGPYEKGHEKAMKKQMKIS